MGIAVVISWMTFALPFGPLSDSFGLDPESLIRPRRLGIYATQFTLVAVLGFVVGSRWLPGVRAPALASGFALGWVLEGVVLTVIGAPLVANEIAPDRAWYYWLVATAGPLQPVVAFLSAWLGQRASSRVTTRS